jgi:O-antigen/teichoic acid export membrane protein
MFTPMAGPAAGLSFLETYVCCLIGGSLSATIFYFGSSYFMHLFQERQARKERKALRLGKKYRQKKKFTKSNRRIIQLKHSIGKWGVCWLVPLFFSIPLGSVITAKFYRHQKNTFILILLGIAINCTLITGGTYLINAFI